MPESNAAGEDGKFEFKITMFIYNSAIFHPILMGDVLNDSEKYFAAMGIKKN